MSKKITDKVTWVGKIDWELKNFHGKEYFTRRGSSYNSYLIRDEKNVLIDTVWKPFDKEFITNLKQEIAFNDIDYIIMNHSESDHSGALPELMREIPDTPIYCTANGAKILKGHYHKDWNYQIVKTGDTLSIGESTLTFLEAPMLHWPDTMFTYMSAEGILFSNDAFGQHYASEAMYNDKAEYSELYEEATKYYANILTPFSKMVVKKIEEILCLKLPVSMICPSHGIIWKDNPLQIVERYLEWAKDYQENQVTIIYDTMWNSTRKMAEAIAYGITKSAPDIRVKLMNASWEDKNDIVTEVFKSKGILLGAPTVNNGYLYSISGILEMLHGLKFKNKSAAAFGSYGWGGEAVKQLSDRLKEAGFRIVQEGLRILWVPDEEGMIECAEFGKRFIASLN
jgi:flavorubredoxin